MSDEDRGEQQDETTTVETETTVQQGKTNHDQPPNGAAVTEPVDTQFPGGNPNNTQDAPAEEPDEDAEGRERG